MHPYFTSVVNISETKWKNILHRGLRFVFIDYKSSYEQLLTKADMCSVGILREKAVICEMYKCLHGLGPWYMREIFTATGIVTRKGLQFEQPRVNQSTYGLDSLRNQGPNLWNKLPLQVKASANRDSLKSNLANYEGTLCRCAMYR